MKPPNQQITPERSSMTADHIGDANKMVTADLVGRLRSAITDYDGSQIADAAQPLDWLTAGDIRSALSEIERLQAGESRYLWLRQRLAVSDIDRLAKCEAEDVEEYNASVDIRIDGYSRPNTWR